jgi:cell division septation protein DedD
MTHRGIALVIGCLLLAAVRGNAQTDSTHKVSPPTDPRDTLFLRARAMVLNGNGTAARAIVDSALNAAVGTPDYGIALYWRGALAATAADAERDYRRVIVEYPFSAHSGDALLALAQLEMARGDRDAAIDHLQRYLIQQPPNDPQRVSAGILLGRLLLEKNQLPKGCAVLLRTRALLGDTAVETRNRVDYYASRCAGVDTSSAAAAPAAVPLPQPAPTKPVAPSPTTSRSTPEPARQTPPSTTPKRDSARRDTAARPDASERTSERYTVQVAAYDTRASAERLVARLKERGIVARVIGSRAPFRVRIGHYTTNAAASAAVRELKGKGIEGFVTTTDNEAPAERR